MLLFYTIINILTQFYLKIIKKLLKNSPSAWLEHATLWLTAIRSNQLSYKGKRINIIISIQLYLKNLLKTFRLTQYNIYI